MKERMTILESLLYNRAKDKVNEGKVINYVDSLWQSKLGMCNVRAMTSKDRWRERGTPTFGYVVLFDSESSVRCATEMELIKYLASIKATYLGKAE